MNSPPRGLAAPSATGAPACSCSPTKGRGDQAIAEALQVGRATVERTRRRFAEEGLQVAPCPPRPGASLPPAQARRGGREAHLVALTGGAPPGGQARWSLRLLADRLVELVAVEGGRLSHETVRRTLKKRA